MIKKISVVFSLLLTMFMILMMGNVYVRASNVVDNNTAYGTARFQTSTATINVSGGSSKYQKIWNQAITGWNQTGVFNFVLTSDNSAQITAFTNSALGNNYTGMTYITLGTDGYIKHVTVELNPRTLKNYHYSTSQISNVAEHELGHSLGLSHNPQRASVMYASNRYYRIQPVDIQNVQLLYATQSDSVPNTHKRIVIKDKVFLKKSQAH